MDSSLPITGRPIRFALVGCGRVSANHVEAPRKHEARAQFVAVCDKRPAALAAAGKQTGARHDASSDARLATGGSSTDADNVDGLVGPVDNEHAHAAAGAYACVDADAVVSHDLPPFALFVGLPARAVVGGADQDLVTAALAACRAVT